MYICTYYRITQYYISLKKGCIKFKAVWHEKSLNPLLVQVDEVLESGRWAMSLLVEEHLVGLEVVESGVLGGIFAGDLIGPAVERRVVVVHLVVFSIPGALLQLRLGNLRNIRPFTLFYIEVRKFKSFPNLRLDLSLMRNSLTNSQERS